MTTTPTLREFALDILLVFWREHQDLQNLKQHLKQQTFQNFNVRVALNEPTDEIHQLFSKELPSWSVFPGPNEGYAGGLERARKESQAPWLLCMNTDVTFPPETLGKFLSWANEADESVGLIVPKVFYPDGRLQSAGGLLMGPEGLCRPRGLGEKDEGQYDHLREVPLMSGCCFLVRRKMLEDVGGFDPKFFMYVEDVDLSLRALWAGWRGIFASDIQVVHQHGGASERYGALQLYHLERNHWWLAPLLPWSMRWQLPFLTLWRWLKLWFSRGQGWDLPQGSARLALKASAAGLLGMPRALGRRSPRRIATQEFLRRLEGHRITLKEFLQSP